MARNHYEHDYEYDWIIKKEGGAAKLKEVMDLEKKVAFANEPKGLGMRSNSKNLYDNREEGKRAIGQQIITGTQRQQLPPKG